MNYYERHIGDYLKDTAHLSLLEHGVYTRLLDVYYTREGAIPEREAHRLIGARSKDEREALAAVLAEFFVLIDGAYSQKRCDEELHAYREGQEGVEDKKLNDKERQRRARERRKALFSELRGHGVVPPWDTKTAELQALLSRVTNARPSGHVTQPVTRDNTATHTPDTRHQTPDPEKNTRTATSTDGGRVCLALKRTGLSGLNPGHPDLLALIAAGATEAEFAGAAQAAVDRGKGFAYALGTLKRQRADAAHTAKTLHTGPMPTAPPPRQSATDRQIATMNALTGKDRNHDRQRAPAADTIDIAARVVP